MEVRHPRPIVTLTPRLGHLRVCGGLVFLLPVFLGSRFSASFPCKSVAKMPFLPPLRGLCVLAVKMLCFFEKSSLALQACKDMQ
ncbi:MAG: hypothetical protein EXS07_06765 [Gemmataceae bacterium]|nr:hypothetical protein [Gemmataceae bacterium]